jgi:hypothetical protein
MVFWGTPAHGQTREEYNQAVATAQAKLSAAQDALQQAEQAYLEAVQRGQLLQTQIDVAKEELQTAQTNYEQTLMLDPSWVRPTKEVQVSEQVSHTIQIPHTETIREVTLVPREVTTLVPGGLTAKSYNMQGYNNAPPLPTENRLVKTETVANIDFQWGSGQVLNSGLYEDVIVNFSGNIQIPTTGTYGFYAPGDDGIKLIIDNNTIINDWYDKGGGGSTTQLYLTEGSHTITLWFYENGGGANVWLYWTKPGYYGWEIVPSSQFGTQTVTETVYDEVITYTDVTTYTEETVFETVWHTETVLDMDAVQPEIQNPDLLVIVNEKQNSLDQLTASQIENSTIIEVTSQNVITKQQELDVAQSELEAIPPFRELPPETKTTTEPTQEPTKTVVEPLPEPDKTSTTEATTTVVEEAQQQLSDRAAQNDTGVLPYTLADAVTEIQAEQVLNALTDPTALMGGISEGMAQTAQFVGELFTNPAETVTAVFKNVSQAGLDMSDDQREKAQEVIVPVVIVSQIASMMVGRIK